jgi:putative ABC transport system ATP-binding protein
LVEAQPANAARAVSRDFEPIRTEGLTKTYALGERRVEALRGVDLRIQTPGYYAVMGPSGSGKSTLLHLLAALDRADSGTITIAGERVDQLTERELTLFRRRKIGVVFQQYNLISTLTAMENVALPAMLDGMPREPRQRRAMELLDRLGLSERAEHRPDALSGGEQQRVAIARALVFEPPILLADEPTGNLDSETSQRLWQLLADLAQQHNITVLMVTHEPDAAAFCEHVWVMRDGRITTDIEVDDLDAAELATRAQRTGR